LHGMMMGRKTRSRHGVFTPCGTFPNPGSLWTRP
jgi:hypothetical protein